VCRLGTAVNQELELDHSAASHCSNCSASVSGHFCHQCGQETVLHPPSAREFMHEFIGHYVAIEGKLWKSLGLLLFRPGRLTLEYINGRRVRYVQPLRMYLTFSLIFFAVLKYAMHDAVTIGEGVRHPPAATARGAHQPPATPDAALVKKQDAGKAADKVADEVADSASGKAADNAPGLVKEDHPGEIVDGMHSVSDMVRPHSAYLADKVEHFGELSFDQRKELLENSFYHYSPYAIFFMMPVFAFYLKLLYLGSGRRYGEHLLFALHTNGFAFLAMSLMILVPSGLGLVEFLLWLWLTLYLPMAMRRVYGGSRKLTALRWLVLVLLHMLTIGMAIALAMVFGLLH
jgi:hypothetical protein